MHHHIWHSADFELFTMDAALSHDFASELLGEGFKFTAPILLKHFLPSLRVVCSAEEPLEVD